MLKTRQKLRKGIIFCVFLTFPVILNYFSPALAAMGAAKGVVSASILVFGLLFISSLFLGRAFCGWACPIGGMQEACFMVTDKKVKGKKIDWIKYVIWGPWIGLLIFLVIRAGGVGGIEPLFMMENGISVSDLSNYITFFMVLLIFLVIAFAVGRRAVCHSICWIAPFMILGRKLRNTLKWPSLRLKSEKEKCVNCKKCTQSCPMSIDVNTLVQSQRIENTECVLCGTCADVCGSSAVRLSFGR
jgi:ferredoxin-type protein NapH